VPSFFVVLEKFPLLPSGKVSRRGLPALDVSTMEKEQYVAPRTTTEVGLCQIWAEVLHAPTVGVHDNFFSMGGHSLIATQVISRVRRLFSVELPLRELFRAPTIEALANRIDKQLLASDLPKRS
jgi:acyl carrier protein